MAQSSEFGYQKKRQNQTSSRNNSNSGGTLLKKEDFPDMNQSQKQSKPQLSNWSSMVKKTNEPKKEDQKNAVGKLEDWVDRPKNETKITGPVISHSYFHEMNRRQNRDDYQGMRMERSDAEISALKESEYWDYKFRDDIRRIDSEMDEEY
jgi:hypothetical protein